MKASVWGSAIVVVFLAACGGRQGAATIPNVPAGDAEIRSSTSGAYAMLHDFRGSPHDGSTPNGYLIADGGNVYGTTSSGGRYCSRHGRGIGCGVVFSITPSGRYRVLHSFKGGSDGSNPVGGLVVLHGLLYGATSGGGSCTASIDGCGTIFSISSRGKERVLYSFKGRSDGAAPSGGLVAMNGVLYGVTEAGGIRGYCKHYSSEGCGTAFAVNTSGDEQVVYRFRGGPKDGSYPFGQLLALGGNLFGTTLFGGYFRHCGNGCGTIFDVTASGVERVLHHFDATSLGSQPDALIALNGRLYGATFNGGAVCGSYGETGCGTVFEATTAGTVRTIYRFKLVREGAGPQSLAAVNGVLYGTTNYGGNDCGASGAYAGVLFAIATSGTKQLIYRFPCGGGGGIVPSPGLLPRGNLLYGTTSLGGGTGSGTIFTFGI
ncbi:MAG TPA: choice-of-anchor tandem repeat GloVer-containing protein [Candidatus Dormibacteraeota bacterium]|nr:choice-of-anchor tandem repeat GloVer-containing protein [Candidatus Dormibacteraeota bacterium]